MKYIDWSSFVLQKMKLSFVLLDQDKLGPFCRSAADCAIVLDSIRGEDPDDLSSRDTHLMDPFLVDITKLTVGYLEDAEMEVSLLLEIQLINSVMSILLTSFWSMTGYPCA